MLDRGKGDVNECDTVRPALINRAPASSRSARSTFALPPRRRDGTCVKVARRRIGLAADMLHRVAHHHTQP